MYSPSSLVTPTAKLPLVEPPPRQSKRRLTWHGGDTPPSQREALQVQAGRPRSVTLHTAALAADASARDAPALAQDPGATLARIDAQIAARVLAHRKICVANFTERRRDNPIHPRCKHFSWNPEEHPTNQVRTDLESLEFMIARLTDAREALIGSL